MWQKTLAKKVENPGMGVRNEGEGCETKVGGDQTRLGIVP